MDLGRRQALIPETSEVHDGSKHRIVLRSLHFGISGPKNNSGPVSDNYEPPEQATGYGRARAQAFGIMLALLRHGFPHCIWAHFFELLLSFQERFQAPIGLEDDLSEIENLQWHHP